MPARLQLLRPTHTRPTLAFVAAAAVVLIAGLAYVAGAREGSRTIAVAARDSLAAVEAVEAFVSFAAVGAVTRGEAPDLGYAVSGMRKLAAVVDAMWSRKNTLSGDAQLGAALRQDADFLESGFRSAYDSHVVHEAFTRTAAAIHDFQKWYYPPLSAAADELVKVAGRIRGDQSWPLQARPVQEFFDRASDVLRGMRELGL